LVAFWLIISKKKMKTTLKNNEKVLLSIRQHWFVLAMPAILTLMFLFVAVLGAKTDYYLYFLLAALGFILYFIYALYDRKTNIWIVTNLRVIDEFGVFSINSKESPLDKINNVSYRKPFLGRIFNFGDVHIQTAAEMGSTWHNMLENPKLLKDTITEYQERLRQEQIQDHAQKLANAVGVNQGVTKPDIFDELTKLHELKVRGIITEEEFIARKTRILNS